MPALKRFFGLFCCVLAFIIFSPTSASSYFTEDFANDTINTSEWQTYPNSGSLNVGGGKLTLLRSATQSNTSPYIYTKNNIFPETGPFTLEIKYRYLSTGAFGDGIVISPGSVPANGVNPDSNLSNYMIFMIYQDAPNGLSFGKFICNQDGSNCNNRTFLRPFTHVPDLNDHLLKIDFTDDGQYIIYLDGNSLPEFVSAIGQRRPKKIWSGNSMATGSSDYWSSLEIDYIHVTTPTDTRTPVIIIPGFGGSWDIGAILSGGTGNNWEIPTFVKNYDGIIQSFKNAGYEEGTDLFVFPYDWRKSLDSLADDLNIFINSKGTAGKFNLVGHSMGGLVARAYGQKYGVTKVDKIYTAGSPHMGLVDMYGLWEGAMSWDNVWWQNVLLEIATEVNRQPNETKVAAIRRVSPSVIDLFPTFPFLLRDNVPVAITSMAQKNAYLSTLNQNADILADKLIPFWSEDIGSTRSTINTTARTEQEALSGQWEDGSPLGADPFGITTGDGTVTKTSAVGPFGVGDKMVGWHADLLSNSDNIGKVFTKLGLDPLLAVSTTTDNRKNSFVAILRSPGVLEVCDKQLTKCNDQLGLYFPEHKLFILPGYDGSNLAVKIKEAGLGTYKLHLGSLDDSPNWVQEDGELKVVDQIDFYGVRSASVSISSTQDTTPPAVSITSPQEKSYQSANLPELTYSVNDDWDESPTIVASTMLQNEGLHTATVSATDDAGNTGQGSVKYTIDNTPPEISISSPKAETYERGKLPKLTYVVKDNWDTNPKVEVSGWSEAVGKHTVTVKATDEASNTKSVSVTYTVENPPTSSPLCKKDKGALYRMFHFKTQAACDKFLDQYHKWRWNNYFTFWRWFNR